MNMDNVEYIFLGDVDLNEITDMVDQLAKKIKRLSRRKYLLCKHLTLQVLEDNVKDETYIERILDNLLDVLMYYEEAEPLLIYRLLCQYYSSINPEAAEHYLYLYRDLDWLFFWLNKMYF